MHRVKINIQYCLIEIYKNSATHPFCNSKFADKSGNTAALQIIHPSVPALVLTSSSYYLCPPIFLRWLRLRLMLDVFVSFSAPPSPFPEHVLRIPQFAPLSRPLTAASVIELRGRVRLFLLLLHLLLLLLLLLLVLLSVEEQEGDSNLTFTRHFP